MIMRNNCWISQIISTEFIIFLLTFVSSIDAKKVILLDTSNSTTELRWKTHSNIDDDEIGWLEETYRGTEGLENRRAYVACNVDQPNVDNWLRTPKILRNDGNRLHIEITFTMRDCNEFPGNTRSCKETFRLYAIQLNNEINIEDIWTSDYWELIDAITSDTGRYSKKTSSSAAVNKETRSFAATKDSVYFAFRDSGACISILNVKVYYEVCSEIIKSFIHFSETVTGTEAHSIIAVDGKCVANSSPTVKLPTFVCKATGSWDMLNGECKCDEGYFPSYMLNICTACALGTYKGNLGEGECRNCPANSRSSQIGSSECSCDNGYYRANDETIHLGCSQPPSKPSHIIVTKIEQTSVTIEWNEPLSLGDRKEIWYRYQCSSCPVNTLAHPSDDTFYDRRLSLSNLGAGFTYTVMIFAENDVSKVATDPSRYALIEFTTRSLSPMLVLDLRVEGVQDDGVTIAWKPPIGVESVVHRLTQSMFEIEMKHNNSISIIETMHTYHTFNNLNSFSPYSFKVRTLTDHGWGSWSEPLWYHPDGNLLMPPSHSAIDRTDENWNSTNSYWPMMLNTASWMWTILICILAAITVLLFTLLLYRNRNKKHFSDCDGLDSYKNGTLTPDYNTPPSQGIMQSFFRGKLEAPLISKYGTPKFTCYEQARFKPYVDPTAYEDPTQALSEFTNDVDPSAIRITDVIGSGEFGEVCKGVLQSNVAHSSSCDAPELQVVAIKTLKLGSSEKAKADFLMEASIMGQFEHENVIRLIGIATVSEPVMIVTEYLENGSLDQFLRNHDDGIIGLSQVVCILRDIAAGMKHLTEKGYIHRDLAARNVLLDARFCCKIADFGLSRGLEDSVEQEYTTNGGKIPVRWTAPEAITHRKFTAASDVWSFGVVMWEVCSFGERPYWEWTNQKVISEVSIGYRLPSPMDTPASLHNLMLRCWHIDRRKRPTFAKILQELEEYVRQPDLIFAEESAMNASTVSPYILRSTLLVDSSSNNIYNIPIHEFLKGIGLSHCLSRLHLAGIQTMSDLIRLGHIDFLSYGLMSEEAQMISKALNRSTLSMHRNLDRIEPHAIGSISSQSSSRLISSPMAAINLKDGFFV